MKSVTNNGVVTPIVSSRTSSETVNWSLKRLKENLNTIKIDKSFQSLARWDDNLRKRYVAAVLNGMAPSKLIFADVESCMNSASDIKDKDYYSEWLDKDTKYLNIDSNNRVTTWMSIFENNLPFPKGTYYSKDGSRMIHIDRDTKWKDLSGDMREVILSNSVTVEIYLKSTRVQLSDIFLAVNDGKPLNSAEKRNAYITKIANVCRNLGEKYYLSKDTRSWIFTGYMGGKQQWKNKLPFTDAKYNRRLMDSVFTNMAAFHTYKFTQNLTESALDLSYGEGSETNKNAENIEKDIEIFMSTWVDNEKYQNSFKKLERISQGTSFDLFVFYIKHGNTIKNVGEFINKFVEANNKLMKNKKPIYEIGDRAHNYASLLRGRDTRKCMKRYEALLDEMKNVLKELDNKIDSVQLIETVD